jgi:hypothetical protein
MRPNVPRQLDNIIRRWTTEMSGAHAAGNEMRDQRGQPSHAIRQRMKFPRPSPANCESILIRVAHFRAGPNAAIVKLELRRIAALPGLSV